MKAINYFKQNRPVHLARRDVYFEQAAELIAAQQSSSPFEIKIADYEEILYLLRVAREHARFSVRDAGSNEIDEQFGRFINLIAGNVKAVLSMMTLKNMVESDGSFFTFLGSNEASVGLQAEEYQRRASDIIRSINNTLKLAGEPFEQLKVENGAAATADELARYGKAREHFVSLVKEGRHRNRIPSSRKITPF
ncbi:hypothetical protein [Pontiella sp.]|uniref:hypothetical protein n=1 Tax=Pontiella sp. TaxID=2837462 RepID=UPI003568D8FB